MSSLAITLIIIAALAHATWNYTAKKAGGGALFAFVNNLLVIPVWGPVVVGVSIWDPSSSPLGWGVMAWCAVILSAVIHAAYYAALLHGYRVAPLSVVYPMARGTGPLISAFSASFIFNEALTTSSIAGILMIIGGVLLLSFTGLKSNTSDDAVSRGVLWGAITGVTISGYTLVDAYAVKTLSMNPIAYDVMMTPIRALIFFPFIFHIRHESMSLLRTHIKSLITIVILSPLAYILVLYAMKIAPVSHVAPARELSLLFGAFFGGKLLKEGHLLRRTTAAAMIAIGVMFLAR